MLYQIDQNDNELLPVIQKYGCLFLCMAQKSPTFFTGIEGVYALNYIWEKATREGIISGDINQDGDFDDAGEAEVQDHNALAKLFNMSVRYDGIHHKADEDIPAGIKFIIGQFYWRGSHFVCLNHRKEVEFDPLGYSNTVKNGTLKTMRFYYAV